MTQMNTLSVQNPQGAVVASFTNTSERNEAYEQTIKDIKASGALNVALLIREQQNLDKAVTFSAEYLNRACINISG